MACLKVANMVHGSRLGLQCVVEESTPDLVIHGHWHHSHWRPAVRQDGGAYEVLGLDADSGAVPGCAGTCALPHVGRLASGIGEAVMGVD
ncbi:MAG: hypothetical protein ACR2GX_00460 [Candidatus Dormibacteria bacterium]